MVRAILQELLDGDAFDPWFLPVRQPSLSPDDILRDDYPNRIEILERIAKKADQFCPCVRCNGGAR
ncbi:MAG: hypothetical protein JNK87_07490 [Bryobacterales bacterium]|nr:hypothetical protein [Bryobacterales bacterium]